MPNLTPMIAALIVAIAAQIIALIAMMFDRRELTKALRAIESVSSSRASRLSAAAASRSDCFSAKYALADLPISPSCSANSNRTCVSVLDSKTSRCGMGFGADIIVFPNVELRGVPLTDAKRSPKT
jgi:hypothetical protein